MKLEKNGNHTVVTLSERNLKTLLTKLQWPESARTIGSNDVYVDGKMVWGETFDVVAESDEQHYGNRPAPPGPMHPKTEEDLRQWRDDDDGLLEYIYP